MRLITNDRYINNFGFKSLFFFCSLPLRLDSYLGCTHGCLYCFSSSLNIPKDGFHRKALPAETRKFERIFENVFKNKSSKGLLRSCLKRKIPIHFGCLSDPFQPQENKSRVTLKLLSVINKYKYPCVISTKSNLLLNDKYLNIINPSNVCIQISFSTLDDNLAKKIEPNTPLPSERLKTLKRLAKKGVWTIARLQPFLYPRERLNKDFFKKISSAGVKHIVLEHLRIPTRSNKKGLNELWQAIGMNLLDEYKKLGMKYSRGNYELESEIKFLNIVSAKRMCNEYGMTFGSGDNDFHHFSDNLCCCGVPNTKPFLNCYKGHLGYGAFRAVKSGRVSFKYIDNAWHPKGSLKQYINEHCRLQGDNETLNFLKHRIQNPKYSNSPLLFYGIEQDSTSHYVFNKDIHCQFAKLLSP